MCSLRAGPQKQGLTIAHRQGVRELFVRVPISDDVKGRDVSFEVHPTRLRLAVNDEVLLQGDFGGHKVALEGGWGICMAPPEDHTS